MQGTQPLWAIQLPQVVGMVVIPIAGNTPRIILVGMAFPEQPVQPTIHLQGKRKQSGIGVG